MLDGVRAVSATNIWVVGTYAAGGAGKTLILHWNGSAWKTVTGPKVGTDDELFAVAASSKSNLWAVGDFSNGGASQALAFHCC